MPLAGPVTRDFQVLPLRAPRFLDALSVPGGGPILPFGVDVVHAGVSAARVGPGLFAIAKGAVSLAIARAVAEVILGLLRAQDIACAGPVAVVLLFTIVPVPIEPGAGGSANGSSPISAVPFATEDISLAEAVVVVRSE